MVSSEHWEIVLQEPRLVVYTSKKKQFPLPTCSYLFEVEMYVSVGGYKGQS